MQFYSDPSRESNSYALPDAEVFYLTAHDAAELDEDLLYEYSRRPEFKLANMNNDIKQQMLDAIVEEQGLTGGWYYWYCCRAACRKARPWVPMRQRKMQ